MPLKFSGQVTGAYYIEPNTSFESDITKRCSKHLYSNLMHYDYLYGLRHMEAELIKCYVDLFNGDEKCCGTFTSGGTESILQAIISLREHALAQKNIKKPELIMANTAHAAFEKACFYFKIKPIIIKVTEKTGYVLTPKQIGKRITSNTIGIICSAGNYPHGLIEPIDEIANLVSASNIPIHVDCCLGGYSMLFSADIGEKVPVFDFRLPQVFSISIDPHKYGMAPKGASCNLSIYKK